MNLRYLDMGKKIAVVEQAPTCRLVQTHRRFLEPVAYYLSMPWVVFFINFRPLGSRSQYSTCEFRVGFRNAELTDADQMLYQPQLPNVHSDLSVCTPGAYGKLDDGELFVRAIDLFWTTSFSSYFPVRIDDRLADFPTWQKNTKENPAFILSVGWRKAATLREMIGQYNEND